MDVHTFNDFLLELCSALKNILGYILCFLVKRVPGRGLEQRESIKTVLYLLIIIIILISYFIIFHY